MFTLEELRSRIKTKGDDLEVVRAKLKSDFFGIDIVIDRVINSIKTWYTFPEFMNRPTIINLWGLTGVGKTALVRNLAKYLTLGDVFVEVQMTSTKASGYYQGSICSELTEANIDPKQIGILLLDEYQRFRTVLDNGEENNDETYKDIWALLSDGRFYNKADIKEDIINLLIGLSSRDSEDDIPETVANKAVKALRATKVKTPTRATGKKAKKRASNAPTALAKTELAKIKKDMESDRVRLMDGITMVNKNSKLGAVKNKIIKRSMWEAKRIKGLLKIEETVMDIMMMPSRDIMEKCHEALRNDTIFEGEAYNKLLIFISGNLDEIYHGLCDETANATIDADIFHEQSKKLTFLDVKEQLLRRFKPEQISRMGNNHVIYPSLDKQTFVKIIHRKLQEAVKNVAESAPIELSYDDKVVQHIYTNSVFPTQGTRPVFSGVQTIFISKIPDILSLCVEYAAASANISIGGTEEKPDMKLSLNTPNGILVRSLSIESPIVEVKNSLSDDAKMCVAVHEAGHAVVFAALFKKAPIQTVLNFAGDATGRVLMSSIGEEVRTLEHNKALICIMYAGLVAERVIFPTAGNTTGGINDIASATKIASSLLRSNGLASTVPVYSSVSKYADEDSPFYVMDTEFLDTQVRSICEQGYHAAEKLVREHAAGVRAVAWALSNKESLGSQEVASILVQNGLECTPMDKSDSLPIPNYVRLFSDKEVAATPEKGKLGKIWEILTKG